MLDVIYCYFFGLPGPFAGDNLFTWEHLHMIISMVLQMGLVVNHFQGQILVDFQAMQHPSYLEDNLVSFPIFHGHSEKETIDYEPWSFGEECEEVCCLALKKRYRLIPHIYQFFLPVLWKQLVPERSKDELWSGSKRTVVLLLHQKSIIPQVVPFGKLVAILSYLFWFYIVEK